MKPCALLAALCGIVILFVGAKPIAAQSPTVATDAFLCETPDTLDMEYARLCIYLPATDEVVVAVEGLNVTKTALSPTGQLVAFAVVPADIDLEAYRSVVYEGPLPANIGILDLRLSADDPDRVIIINDQTTSNPPNEDYSEDYPLAVYRTQPVWSVDGTQIAWMQYDNTQPYFAGHVGIYDTTTGQSRVLEARLSLGWADGGFWGVPDLRGWAGDYLVSTSTDYQPAYDAAPDGPFGTTLALVDSVTGLAIHRPIDYLTSFEDVGSMRALVRYEGEGRVLLHYQQTGWVVYDPATDSFSALQELPAITASIPSSWTIRTTADGANYEYFNPNVAEGVILTGGAPDYFDLAGDPMRLFAEEGWQVLRDTDWEPLPTLPDDAPLRYFEPRVSAQWLVTGPTTPVTPADWMFAEE